MKKLFCWSFSRFVQPGTMAVLAAATLIGLGLAAPVAQASYLVTVEQVGSNVVASGSGTIDLTGLTFDGGFASGPAALDPSIGYINTGPTTSVGLDAYTGFTGPTSFGSGGFTGASSGTGDSVEIIGSSGTYGVPLLWVPSGYVSGSALSDNSTYDSATFSSLGLTPGTYEWTWGIGANQNFTLQIEATPEPSSLLLFASALLAGLWLGRKQIFAHSACS